MSPEAWRRRDLQSAPDHDGEAGGRGRGGSGVLPPPARQPAAGHRGAVPIPDPDRPVAVPGHPGTTNGNEQANHNGGGLKFGPDGKLYLFYNSLFNNTLPKWEKAEADLKAKADKNWKSIYK